MRSRVLSQSIDRSRSISATMSQSLRTPILFLMVFFLGANVHRMGLFTDDSSPSNHATAVKKSIVGDQDYSAAFVESRGFFDDIPQGDWNRYKAWARKQQDHRYMKDPERNYDPSDAAKWYYDNFYPTLNCPHAKRIGGVPDGAKWVCDPHRLITIAEQRKAKGEPGPHCIVYSVGSNGNYGFEDDLISEIGTICEIHVFDFSGDFERPQNKEKNIHFHKWGLQASSENLSTKEDIFYSFPEILKLLGHEEKVIDIFKIDCERCEWKTQHDWINHDITQVLIETHGLPKEWSKGLNYYQAYNKNHFAMFYREANLYTKGKCHEWSYVKLAPEFWKKV
jgi:Methyltransferase domain